MNKFDKVAEFWDTKTGRANMAEKFADEVKQVINEKNFKTALEYGCGTANVSFSLKDNFDSITLADSSQGMLDEVKKKIKQAKTTHLSPVLLNLEKDSITDKYDVIFTLMTMHHIQNVAVVMTKFHEMLNPGGVLIIGDLEKEDGNFHQHPENLEVHHGFEKEYLIELATANHFILPEYKIFHKIERTHTGSAKEYTLFSMVISTNSNCTDYKGLYNKTDKEIMKTASDSLNRKTNRIIEIIAYAREAKINHIGIANCTSVDKEAQTLANQLKKEGFTVETVHCKYGKVPLSNFVEDKKGLACNPAGQAKFLAEKGTQLNIMMGLCIGHDMIFNEKSKAPVTPLVVKDRKENHNTIRLLTNN